MLGKSKKKTKSKEAVEVDVSSDTQIPAAEGFSLKKIVLKNIVEYEGNLYGGIVVRDENLANKLLELDTQAEKEN